MGPHRNATAGPSTIPENNSRRLLGRSCDRCRKRKVRCGKSISGLARTYPPDDPYSYGLIAYDRDRRGGPLQ